MKVIAIAEHTFREAVRNKIMHAILGLALVIILCSKAIAWVSAGEDVKVMTDLGLAAITLFGVIVAVFSGANLLYKEVDKRTSYLILPKPIKRYEFIVGKYFGLMLVLLICTAIMSAVHAAYLTSFVFSREEVLHGAGLRALYLALTQAYFLIFLELCVVSAFAIFFSSVSSPMFSAIATFCVYFMGHGLRNLKDLTDTVGSAFADKVLMVMYYVLPGLFNFDMKHRAAYANPQSMNDIIWCITYAAAYCAVVLALTCVIFRRKQL
jgi:ABC-type transport system involved in multi-copper enzyme maturation permease subunit